MQVVGYETGAGEGPPALRVASDGTVAPVTLEPGTDLAYRLKARHCAGTTDADGTHVPCDAPAAPYCDRHTDRWACARCTGDCDLPLPACHEEHAIYLAAFAPATFKVGVTRSWRLETRLREQGADRAAHLRTVADGRIAREIEAEIAADVGDRVRVPTKIAGLHRRVDEPRWEALLDGFETIARYDLDYGLSLADRPMAETMATGTVRGVKGRVLVLATEAGVYAVDLRDLVGYDLAPGESQRARQASLGAFD